MSADPPNPAEETPRETARRRRARLSDTPQLPRRAGFRVSTAQLVKIGMTAGMLVLLLVVQKPCADSVSKLVTNFGSAGSGSAAAMPKPGTVDVVPARPVIRTDNLETMPEHMTKAEYEAMVARARARDAAAKAPAGSGSGSAGSASAGSGSGSGSTQTVPRK